VDESTADTLDKLSTVFLLAPLTILSARGKRAPGWMTAALVVVTVWQAYRAVIDLGARQ